MDDSRADIERLIRENERLRQERETLLCEIDKRNTQLYFMNDVIASNHELQGRLAGASFGSSGESQQALERFEKQNKEYEAMLDSILRSTSWRVTRPIRAVSESLRGSKGKRST